MKKIFLALFALALGFTACVEDEVYKSIVSLSHDPASVTPDNDVTVTAVANGIRTLTLKYKVGDAAERSVNMTRNDRTFRGVIPRQADQAVVTYYVEGEGVRSNENGFTVAEVPTDYTQLVLNEINGDQKFVEIYNKGTLPIDLQGVKVERNDGQSSYTQTTSHIIPAGGYAVVAGRFSEYHAKDPGEPEGTLIGEMDSGLSQGQSLRIALYAPDGTVIDQFIRLKADSGHSWGNNNQTDYPNEGPYVRSPNGDGQWFTADADTGTAGRENPATTKPILNVVQ